MDKGQRLGDGPDGVCGCEVAGLCMILAESAGRPV